MHLSLSEILNAVKYLADNWTTIGAYSAGGVSVATLAHAVERKYGNLSLQKLGYTIVALGSLLAVLAQFALHAHQAGATWHVLPQNFGFLAGPALFLHKFVVSDGFEALAGKLSSISNKIQQAETILGELEGKQPLPAEITPPNDNQFIG